MKEILIIILTVSACMFLGIYIGSQRDVNEEVKKHFEFFEGGYKQGYQDGYNERAFIMPREN